MAKRRNAKKEKAERNKINARKYRKPSSRYSGRGKKYYNNSKSKTEENQSSSSDAASNT